MQSGKHAESKLQNFLDEMARQENPCFVMQNLAAESNFDISVSILPQYMETKDWMHCLNLVSYFSESSKSFKIEIQSKQEATDENHSEAFNAVLQETLLELIQLNKFHQVLSNLTDAEFQQTRSVVQDLCRENFLLLHAVAAKEEVTSFNILFGFLQKNDYKTYDNDRNSLLHVASAKCLIQIIRLQLATEINAMNVHYQTPLHFAALKGDKEKAQLLLQLNADPNIQDRNQQTFWTIPTAATPNELDIYRSFYSSGYVLAPPPVILSQQGLNCGYYAAACATLYLYHSDSKFFKDPPLPARKRDTNPKASHSLREFRKALGIPYEGPIYSARHLVRLIRKNGCEGVLHKINNYAQFIETIKTALQQHFPIIVGFSSNPQNGSLPAVTPDTRRLHWATIIGWKLETDEEYILLAEHGKYVSVKARELFNAFYNLEKRVPTHYLFKKGKSDWERRIQPVIPTENMKVTEIKDVELHSFRRNLVIVFPPQYDLKLFRVNNQEEESASHIKKRFKRN